MLYDIWEMNAGVKEKQRLTKKQVREFLLDDNSYWSGDRPVSDFAVYGANGQIPLTEFVEESDYYSQESWDRIVNA